MKHISIISLAALLAGCSTITGVTSNQRGPISNAEHIADYGELNSRENSHEDPEKVSIQLYLDNYIKAVDRDAKPSTSYEEALARFEVKLTSDQKRAARNAILGSLLGASEKNCGFYLENLRGVEAGSASSLGIIGHLFNAGSLIATDAPTKTGLTAMNELMTNSSATIKTEVFANAGSSMLATAVRAARLEARTTLEDRMGEEYLGYPLSMAVADTYYYHSLCNVVTGAAYTTKALAEESKTNSNDSGNGTGDDDSDGGNDVVVTTTTTQDDGTQVIVEESRPQAERFTTF